MDPFEIACDGGETFLISHLKRRDTFVYIILELHRTISVNVRARNNLNRTSKYTDVRKVMGPEKQWIAAAKP